MTDRGEVLRSVDIFSDFPEEFLGRLAGVSELRTFAKDETIVTQHDPATAFFIVTRGRLDVIHRDERAGAVILACLEPGQFFGEMALLNTGTRTATVRASEDAECLVLEKAAFDAELRKDPNSAAVMATRLARRINRLRRQA